MSTDTRTSHVAVDPHTRGLQNLGKTLRTLGLVHDQATARAWAHIVTNWPPLNPGEREQAG